MLAIRLQRTGRKGYPTYRVIVQEAHRQPTSGRLVTNLGHYNPHTKEVVIDKEQAETYLKNGEQPSDRVVKLFAAQKIALPDWVKQPASGKQKTIKNAEKLRKNQPKEEAPAEQAVSESEPEAPVEETVTPETEVTEVPAETQAAPAAEAPAEETTEEA